MQRQDSSAKLFTPAISQEALLKLKVAAQVADRLYELINVAPFVNGEDFGNKCYGQFQFVVFAAVYLPADKAFLKNREQLQSNNVHQRCAEMIPKLFGKGEADLSVDTDGMIELLVGCVMSHANEAFNHIISKIKLDLASPDNALLAKKLFNEAITNANVSVAKSLLEQAKIDLKERVLIPHAERMYAPLAIAQTYLAQILLRLGGIFLDASQVSEEIQNEIMGDEAFILSDEAIIAKLDNLGELFTLLLEHGADPDLVFTDEEEFSARKIASNEKLAITDEKSPLRKELSDDVANKINDVLDIVVNAPTLENSNVHSLN